jgi:hypothetical protein
MTACVPELGPGGWVTDPIRTLDLIFSHCLESDYSQSTVFYKMVTSIAYIIAFYQNNPAQLASELESRLELYFKRYFNTAQVQVTTGTVVEGRYNIDVIASVTRDGKTYQLGKIVEIEGGKIKKVIAQANR